jgi:hypothetical protein
MILVCVRVAAIDVGLDPRTLGFNPAFNPIFEAGFAIEGIRPADGNADRVVSFDAGAFEFPNAAACQCWH